MKRFVYLALLLCLMPSPSVAGAWMRGEGTAFLSTGLSIYNDHDSGERRYEPGFYGEFGLRDTLTIGVSGSTVDGETGEAQAFLRLPILNDDGPVKIAFEVGIGTGVIIGETAGPKGYKLDPFLRLGASVGRGIKIGSRYGWLNVDANMQEPWEEGETQYKLDTTLGLNLSDRVQIMGQVFFESDVYGSSTTFSPNVIYALKGGKSKLVLGAEFRTGRAEREGLRISFWKDF